MSVPTKPVVDDATAGALAALALGQTAMLEQAEDMREQLRKSSGLDPRAFSLVKIAALVAIDAPPASFLWVCSRRSPRRSGCRGWWPPRPRSCWRSTLSCPTTRTAEGGGHVRKEAAPAPGRGGRRRRVHGGQGRRQPVG